MKERRRRGVERDEREEEEMWTEIIGENDKVERRISDKDSGNQRGRDTEWIKCLLQIFR